MNKLDYNHSLYLVDQIRDKFIEIEDHENSIKSRYKEDRKKQLFLQTEILRIRLLIKKDKDELISLLNKSI